MAYFEREGVLLSLNQLITEVKSHYMTQAIQQSYVFILGLDVLGNPYGLIKDFTQGLGDFFYEPFMVYCSLVCVCVCVCVCGVDLSMLILCFICLFCNYLF